MPTRKTSKKASRPKPKIKTTRTGARRPVQYADHSTDLKAHCIAALLAGQGLSETAREYKVPKSTLKGWRDALPSDKIARLRTKQNERLDDKIADYLEQIIDTTTAIAETVADPAYIRRHSPESNAVMFGVMSDKGFRVLEAVQRAADPTTGVEEDDVDGAGDQQTKGEGDAQK